MDGALQHLSVIVASAGRPKILHETIAALRRLRARPQEIIVSVPEGDHVLPETAQAPGVRVVRSDLGLTRQRNRGIAALGDAAQIVTFLDDDVELRDGYFFAIDRAFRERPDIVFMRGHVVADGPRDGIESHADARRILHVDALLHAGHDEPLDVAPITCRDAYGCNMNVRRSTLRSLAFDERLPLYGLMEDLDFAQQCSRSGGLALCRNARMVHLGVRSGRLPGARLGYSQVMNPVYIWTKGNIPTGYLVREVARHLSANALKALAPSQSRDRRARLAGNIRAVWSLLQGRIAPEDMLKIRPGDAMPTAAESRPAPMPCQATGRRRPASLSSDR